jgi:hypothetical protein
MKVYIVQDYANVIMGVYAHRNDANKVRDYLGAGHFVTEYEVKTEITNQ